MIPRSICRAALLAATLLMTGCAVRWVVQDDPSAGERVHALVVRHHAQLDRAVGLLNQAKVAIPLAGTRLLNGLGFEVANQAPVLAIYTNGREVKNDQTRFQRAVASFGEDATTILHALDKSGLLDANPDYQTLKLGEFYRVRDAIMTSDIGGTLTAEPESAEFYLPLAGAKAFAEGQLPFKELINQSKVVGDEGQALPGHLY